MAGSRPRASITASVTSPSACRACIPNGSQAGGAGDEKVWGLSLNSTYAYGPGINLEAQFAYTAANYGGAAAAPFFTGLPPVHAIEVDLGTAINF